MRGERFGCRVVLEGHDIDRFAGGACDGRDARGVEGFVTGLPLGKDGIVDGECDRRLGGIFERTWWRGWRPVACLVCRVLLFRPFLRHWWRCRVLGLDRRC